MPEGFNSGIERLKKHADVRSRVAAAVEEGITHMVVKNDLGGVNGNKLIEAARESLAGDVTTLDEDSLKLTAEKAVEKMLGVLGFDNAETLADFYVTVDSRLQNNKVR